jgi:hypothetical protein
MFVGQVQVYWRSSHSKVRYIFYDLNDTDELVAEFQESVRAAIPQDIALFSNNTSIVRRAGADEGKA